MGDFNQVLKQSDKLSMTNGSLQGAEAFRECLDSCFLTEVKAKGLHYTWSNRRGDDQVTWERLDRAFANAKWFELNGEAVLENLPITASDHSPLLLNLERSTEFKKRPYRFELMWTTDPQCEQVVAQAWNTDQQGSVAFNLARKIQATKERLKVWNKCHFGDLSRRKKALEEELTRAQQQIEMPENRHREEIIRRELETLLEQEQLMWMQKSRANWYIQGERNTRYFHLTTKKRRVRNRITNIRRMDGESTDDPKEIEEAFLSNFKRIYCSEDLASKSQMESFLQGLNLPKNSDEQLQHLNAPFKAEEDIC
ncbi:Endonuclease/exonuclease/phosphatase [Corchorus olitorius]|uniref:Endonuclease/exonuclease/phosphatase n=1 Tax=Corchorus olitorius TaxID=93759 RepID=A0A1R3ITC4_9ROSI|nr:Endonuclease/exonuclease/phosphatase [Corchorus olitorius]